VTFREQTSAEESHQESGKFRSLLYDIFGQAFEAGQAFRVDHDAVRRYKDKVDANMQGLHNLEMQLQALTDFPTRLFAELHQLDQFARLHHCDLQLLGLDEAIAAVVRTSPQAVSHDRIQLRLEAGHRSTSDRPAHATRLAATCTTPELTASRVGPER